MTEPEAPPAITGVTPYINTSDASAAADFYVTAFGATIVSKMDGEGGKLMHCHMLINGGTLLMSDFFPQYGHPYVAPQAFNLHLQVDDANNWWQRAVDAGCTVLNPLKQEFWGDYYGQLKDPYGVTWAIGSTPKK